MVGEESKFYSAIFLLLSPFLFAIIAYASAYTTSLCAGFRVELFYLWPIIALFPLLSYTRLGRRMSGALYRFGTAASGALYSYLFYSLTVPQLRCDWFVYGMAYSFIVAWALAVALLYIILTAFNIPVGYVPVIAASEFYLFYLAFALYSGQIHVFCAV